MNQNFIEEKDFRRHFSQRPYFRDKEIEVPKDCETEVVECNELELCSKERRKK